jgi:glutamate synthase domain-containing protein 2/glutamate synthase domain-containing protein 1/glutamate synthase domain-containing protein 3
MAKAQPLANVPGLPSAQGLYDPRLEHDSCGVGMVCRLDGAKTHRIIADGLQILLNLRHRGAYGCDARTGDGAGILMQMPHAFLEAAAGNDGMRVPQEGDYACGLVFLPPDAVQRRQLMEMCAAAVQAEQQEFLGWRQVPVRPEVLGPIARAVEPAIYQIFIGRGRGLKDRAHFERKLYVIRKVMERKAGRSGLPQSRFFYVPSLSSRTLVYKGMFLADQIGPYYPDLADPAMVSALALVHQRYSTNTFPTWDLAHPFRFLCHNGEINTLRGNVNWMNARQQLFRSELFGDDMAKLFPIATPGASDSAILDNTLELLYHSGRSLAHCVMMLIPEAWQGHATMPDSRKAFYEYHGCLMEPWDGPASITFSDGIQVGAVLDRNGLRPSRYTVTTDGRVIMGSETGVMEIAPEKVAAKGRLQPGRMFLIDLQQGRIIEDDEIKEGLSQRCPYRQWLKANLVRLEDLPAAAASPPMNAAELFRLQKAFGYTLEDLKFIIGPMCRQGQEPLGSMGEDTPPAVLSDQPRPLFDYFRQLFAQVTNPPLDAIREELVTSMKTTIGAEGDLFAETPRHCRQLQLAQPILTDADLERIRENKAAGVRAVTLSTLYAVDEGAPGLQSSMERLCRQAAAVVDEGAAILILSDRGVDRRHAAIPILLAASGVHHHLIREGRRTRCGLVVESAEPREVHHYCVLIGYGAGAINPYLALAAIDQMVRTGQLPDLTTEGAIKNYIKATVKGTLKVMSKMGISTLQSYRGAQIFECIGLHGELVDRYFSGTPSRIGGAGLERIAGQAARQHAEAFSAAPIPSSDQLPLGGKYQWRRGGEVHQYTPMSIAKLQQAVRGNDRRAWEAFAALVDGQNRKGALIRGLLDFKPAGQPLPLEQVEPWTEIVKRFKTGGMSYGSISKEAHETLAIAMNRIGGKSNSGEGGEDADRYRPDADGNWRNSAIKQVASGRFGVTIDYLVNANELQIKMAQGAKPGEGGQLPGFKVYPCIAKTRHATPYVGLISPPPHHDIYSIEDLAQLIHDLKNANPEARVSVKLVSEIGVGTIAAGVVKGKADVVLISGDAGGTGASPLTSIKHGGLPWELGLAETQQTLVLNGLRHKIVVECDGQLKTGRDVAVACLLGAEEFGFGTVSLVALGCVMMRVCHLNTCPVGIATQDPELRKKFAGRPEHVIRFMRFVAEDLRAVMARLGFRSVAEMVGRSDCLDFKPALAYWQERGLDLSGILHQPEPPPAIAAHCGAPADTGIGEVLDRDLIRRAQPALEHRQPVQLELEIRNTQRTVGTLLSSIIVEKYGGEGLPPDTIVLRCTGSAGQSFLAFGAPGLSAHVAGEANDYFGKGLSGAKLIIRPPAGSTFPPEKNIVIGNVAFYGATAGAAYISGVAGERFCVRNSGVRAVVEGVGDHGCEYMTGGCVAVLGATGRNFAAGMSGGTAYVHDPDGCFAGERCNLEMVDLEALGDADRELLTAMVRDHVRYTESPLAQRLLADWEANLKHFVKVMPQDYKKALERIGRETAA